MANNKHRLITSQYTEYSDERLLSELKSARTATNTLKDSSAYDNALDVNGVYILVEELNRRGYETNLTLLG